MITKRDLEQYPVPYSTYEEARKHMKIEENPGYTKAGYGAIMCTLKVAEASYIFYTTADSLQESYPTLEDKKEYIARRLWNDIENARSAS